MGSDCGETQPLTAGNVDPLLADFGEDDVEGPAGFVLCPGAFQVAVVGSKPQPTARPRRLAHVYFDKAAVGGEHVSRLAEGSKRLVVHQDCQLLARF